MDLIDQNEKTLVFCASQDHAAAVRDLINQNKKSKDPNYCVRVTANDGELGEQYLREFQDNEKSIPTILTTSQKLSTGVDARNVRNIVLMRPANNIIEFKQIIGRGTRLFDDKNFFTIYDFVNASVRFNDPEWDGEPLEPVEYDPKPPKSGEGSLKDPTPPYPDPEPKVKIKVTLANGKEREILHYVATTFIGPDGKVMSVQEFLNALYGKLPNLFKDEAELRKIWSNPLTRKVFLEKLDEAGFGSDELKSLQKAIDAEKCDLFDVLEFISYAFDPITREKRVAMAQSAIYQGLEPQQKEFLDFVLSRYIETGVEELESEKLPALLNLKYNSVNDAAERLGGIPKIREAFISFQRHLYAHYVGV